MISVDDLSVHLKIGKLPAWQRALIVGLAEIDVHKRAAELAALSHHAQIHSATMSRCHQFQAADAVRVAEFQPEIVSYSAFKPFFCFHSRSARTVQLAFVEPNADQSGELPKDDGWIYEAKLNSYPCLVPWRKGGTAFWSRRNTIFTARFP